MRFTHYAAKIYGYKFKNADAADKANAMAMEKVLKLYREEMEFENNKHLYGFIMNTFRYAILNSFRKKSADKLETYNESQLTYGEGKEEYSVYYNSATSSDKEYSDSAKTMIDIMKKSFSDIEFRVFYLKYEYDYSVKEIANDLEISTAAVSTIKRRIQKKFNQIKLNLDEDGVEREKKLAEKAKSKAILRASIHSNIRLREEARNRRVEKNEKKRVCRSEALSWINIDPQI